MKLQPVVAMLTVVAALACSRVTSPIAPAILPEQDSSVVLVSDASTRTEVGARADASAVAEAGPVEPVVVVTSDRISVGGGRSFLWARTGTEPPNAPLLMVLHGDGGDGVGMRAYVGAALERLAFAQAHVLYLDGADRTWDTNNVGSPADLAYLNAVYGSFTGTRKPRAVYLFGYSRGGFMANLLACQQSNWVTAIASNAGGAPYATSIKGADGVSRCPGQKPVASIALHGMQDSEVVFAEAPWTGRYWANVNGCDTQRSMVATGESVCEAYSGCPAENPSWFCAVPGLGHSIWGDAPRVAWSFFMGLPR